MTEAPRWRLTEPHYLNVFQLPDGTRIEWEHKETARETGRMVRKLFKVPCLLDPRDGADFNYPGEIIVAHAVDGASNLRNDIIFEGDPTPNGMEPLNEAAQVISDAVRAKAIDPIKAIPINGNMSDAETAFMERMMQAMSGVAAAANQTVPKQQYDELLARVAALEQAKSTPTPAVERRA